MFSFFKRKPKLSDEANRDLAEMLSECPENPVAKSDFFHRQSMDYSVHSLQIVDQYLEHLRTDPPEDEELVKVALHAGSYVGEVIRRNSRIDYHWLAFSEAAKLSDAVRAMGMGLSTAAILWSTPDCFVFPVAKVVKRLGNGPEDSVEAFAKVYIDGIAE